MDRRDTALWNGERSRSLRWVYSWVPVWRRVRQGAYLQDGSNHVQKLMPDLFEHIAEGRLAPEVIISHRLKLADAGKGYEMFDTKDDNCRKVVMTP